MIEPRQLLELLAARPFSAFRVRMADGESYEVLNRRQVAPMDSRLFIALPNDRWKFLPYVNMTCIEASDSPA
jgi:hypothetical protein